MLQNKVLTELKKIYSKKIDIVVEKNVERVEKIA